MRANEKASEEGVTELEKGEGEGKEYRKVRKGYKECERKKEERGRRGKETEKAKTEGQIWKVNREGRDGGRLMEE